jgi:hypothetical protein
MNEGLESPLIQHGRDDEESMVQETKKTKLSMRNTGARRFNLEEFTKLLDGYQDHLHVELAA